VQPRASDGYTCVSLLKVLMTNVCAYDCAYCVNRRSNDVPRAAFTPRELAELTIEFYRRNYIEGLFISSAVAGSADGTTERMISALTLLRRDFAFGGYIHAKALPGTAPDLLRQLGALADRLSVNIELPSKESLALLAPDKSKHDILEPMGFIHGEKARLAEEAKHFRHVPSFAPAGQSTQMIVGATEETDYRILRLSQGLYQKYALKRVFFSAYVPVADSPRLPAREGFVTPLLREHRLYQADWLLRFYHFRAEEILSEDAPSLHPLVDPKCNWALNHPAFFPVETNTADLNTLLRVPGVGPVGARRIVEARRWRALDFSHLKKLGIVLKRAQYFLTCSGRKPEGLSLRGDSVLRNLIAVERPALPGGETAVQTSLFDPAEPLPFPLREKLERTPLYLEGIS
jgi:putative DNA modification/repair radical SAM protein